MASEKNSEALSHEKMLLCITKRKNDSQDDYENVSDPVVTGSKSAVALPFKVLTAKTVTNTAVARLKQNRPVMANAYDVSMPADFLAGEGTSNGIWLAADKLLFPIAKQRLKPENVSMNLSNGIQLQLQVDKRLKSLNNRAHLVESARNELQMSLEATEKNSKRRT